MGSTAGSVTRWRESSWCERENPRHAPLLVHTASLVEDIVEYGRAVERRGVPVRADNAMSLTGNDLPAGVAPTVRDLDPLASTLTEAGRIACRCPGHLGLDHRVVIDGTGGLIDENFEERCLRVREAAASAPLAFLVTQVVVTGCCPISCV